MNRKQVSCIAVVASIAVSGSLRAQPVQLIDGPPGTFIGGVRGISADGTALAVRISTPTSDPLTYRWTVSGGWDSPGIPGELTGISADGSTYVGREWLPTPPNPTFGRTFYWRPPAPPVFLEPGTVNAVSADGSVIVGQRWNPGTQRYDAYRWTAPTGYLALPHLVPQGSAEATDVSADGAVVIGWDHDPLASTGTRAFIWILNAGIREIFPPPGSPTSGLVPYALSSDGRAVAGYTFEINVGTRALIWTESLGGARFLNMPAGVIGSAADATSADGSVILGDKYPPEGLPSAFIWDRALGTRDLKQLLLARGATILADKRVLADAVSADGSVIAGTAGSQGFPLLDNRLLLAGLPAFCYANCDGSTSPSILNVSDFVCFLTRFSANDAYANCDQSTAIPRLNVADFVCFQQKFAAGCP